MTDELFADRMTEILQIGSTVRINLESLASEQSRHGASHSYVTRQRIVMPIEGFLQSFAAMEKLVAQLLSAGVISRGDHPPAETSAPASFSSVPDIRPIVAEESEAQATGPISPNFHR